MKKIIAIAVFSALTTTTFAADSGLYVAGQIGMAPTTFDVDTTGMTADVKSPVSFGGTVGYAVNSNFSVEASYVDLGKITWKAIGFPMTIGIKSTLISGTAVGSYPLSQQLSVIGKLGFASATSKVDCADSVFCSGATFPPDAKKSAITYGLGAQYNLSDKLGLRLTYDHFSLGDKTSTNTIDPGRANLLSVSGVFRF